MSGAAGDIQPKCHHKEHPGEGVFKSHDCIQKLVKLIILLRHANVNKTENTSQMDNRTERVDLAIVGGRCLTMDPQNRGFSDSLILIRKGKIIWLGERGEYQGRYEAKKTLQASGKLIIPAFINAHTHLSLSLSRSLRTALR